MIWRLRSRKTFSELRTHGRRLRSGPVRLVYLSTPTPHPLVGFALGRRFGNAVERNRARRRLRAAFADAWSIRRAADRPVGAFQLSGSGALLSIEFARLVNHLGSCLDQCAATAGPTSAPADPTLVSGAGAPQ